MHHLEDRKQILGHVFHKHWIETLAQFAPNPCIERPVRTQASEPRPTGMPALLADSRCLQSWRAYHLRCASLSRVAGKVSWKY